MASTVAWISLTGMLGSKIITFGPKSGWSCPPGGFAKTVVLIISATSSAARSNMLIDLNFNNPILLLSWQVKLFCSGKPLNGGQIQQFNKSGQRKREFVYNQRKVRSTIFYHIGQVKTCKGLYPSVPNLVQLFVKGTSYMGKNSPPFQCF
jgi:hypothetical protein